MDSLRFHWVSNLDVNRFDVSRFTRLAFDLTQPPFILEVTLKSTLIITNLCIQSSLKIYKTTFM